MIKTDQMTNINLPLLLTIREWILDNGGKPYLHFKIDENCKLPIHYTKDTQIIIDTSPGAIKDLLIDEQGVSLNARFNRLEESLYFPFQNIFAISGGPEFEFGVNFPLFTNVFKEATAPEPIATPEPPKRINHLTIVK